jgi:hypothetical protein
MKDLEHYAKLINSYPSDIKAEVLLADLLQEGFTTSEILVFFNSMFKRKFSRDILKAEKLRINDFDEVLAVYLARDGIYDLLPEGLFHSTPSNVLESAKDMAADSRKELKVELEARKFFRPFENEFFYQRIQLELLERQMLQKFHDNGADDFFLNFWKIDQSLPRELTNRLASMLPFVKDIVGDFDMTANCLSLILGEEVKYTLSYSLEPHVKTATHIQDYALALGQAELGINLVTSGHSVENRKLIRFQIGPLNKTSADPYLENGEYARFIDCFSAFFIPMEIDFEFTVNMLKENQEFILDPAINQCIMGYTTII